MNFLKHFTPTLDALKSNTSKTLSKLKSSFSKQQQIECTGTQPIPFGTILKIIDRIYYLKMSYIDSQSLKKSSAALNQQFGTQYLLWNLSEIQYDTQLFNDQVAEHCYIGYPNPPLDVIFIICKNIINWLESDEKNIVVIHCQQSQGRSALIISCLLTLMQLFQHPGEALTYFCKLIGGNDQKILFPSQSLYLKYYANVLDGIKVLKNYLIFKKLNSNPLILLKIIFSEVPTLNFKKTKNTAQEKSNQDESLFPYCQIFSNSEPIYNSLKEEKKIQPYKKEDISIWFEADIKVDGDILIRIRHFQNENQRLPLFRIMLHTGFVFDNVARFYHKDLDIARFLNVSENFFIDIIFQQAPEQPKDEEEKIDEQQSGEKRRKKNSVDDIDFIVNQIGRKNNQELNKEDQEDSLIYKSRSSLSEEKEQNEEQEDQIEQENQAANDILEPLQEAENNEKENQ